MQAATAEAQQGPLEPQDATEGRHSEQQQHQGPPERASEERGQAENRPEEDADASRRILPQCAIFNFVLDSGSQKHKL